MHVGYLLNQYPYASCTFIRREIVELERLGLRISRFAIRPTDHELVDEHDRAEVSKTRCILRGGALALLVAFLRCAFANPRQFLTALGLALRMGRRSDRGRFVHLIYLTEACVLRRWCADLGVEHLHCHFGTNAPAVAMLCKLLGGPSYSFTVHGPEEFDKPQFIHLREKISRAAFVIAISEYGRSQLYRWAAYADWTKIKVVRCGVDLAFLNQAVTSPPLAPRLVCIGRLAEQKGQLLLVQAAAMLAMDRRPAEIVLVGDGPMRPQIEKLIKAMDLGAHVRITGFLSNDDVRRELLASRALVLPSFAEGLPVVIMEALAVGRPVISTYVAGIPELVEPGVCGWLVPAGDAARLADAMRMALGASQQRLMEMGRAGSERVARDHDVSIEAAKLARLLAHALGNGQACAEVQALAEMRLAGARA